LATRLLDQDEPGVYAEDQRVARGSDHSVGSVKRMEPRKLPADRADLGHPGPGQHRWPVHLSARVPRWSRRVLLQRSGPQVQRPKVLASAAGILDQGNHGDFVDLSRDRELHGDDGRRGRPLRDPQPADLERRSGCQGGPGQGCEPGCAIGARRASDADQSLVGRL